MSSLPHSAEYIKDDRFDWWNQDFLRLLKARILGERSVAMRLADFGVGEGHWSLSLVQAFGDIVEVTGVDRDQEWCRRAAAKYAKLAPQVSFYAVASDAHATSLAGRSFDIVTAQTLLMHSVRPQEILGEMARVAKCGGLVVCVEPVNHMNWAQLFELRHYCSPDERARFYGIWIRFVESIRASKGDQDIGLRLPTLFRQCGLEQIRAWFNDRIDLEPTAGFRIDFLEEELGRDRVMKALIEAGVNEDEIAFVRAMIQRVRVESPRDVDLIVHAPMNIVCVGTVAAAQTKEVS